MQKQQQLLFNKTEDPENMEFPMHYMTYIFIDVLRSV